MKGGFSHPMQLLAKVFGNSELLTELVGKVRKTVTDVKEGEVLQSLVALFVFDPDSGPLEQYTQSKLVAGNGKFRSEFTSQMIGDFIRGVSIESAAGEPLTFAKICVERETLIQIEAVKHLNYMLMIMSPRLKVVEYRGYDVVQTIFDALGNDGGHELLPDDIQQMHARLKQKAQKMRVICDFVAGMTDRYAIEFYSRLKESGATIYKPL